MENIEFEIKNIQFGAKNLYDRILNTVSSIIHITISTESADPIRKHQTYKRHRIQWNTKLKMDRPRPRPDVLEKPIPTKPPETIQTDPGNERDHKTLERRLPSQRSARVCRKGGTCVSRSAVAETRGRPRWNIDGVQVRAQVPITVVRVWVVALLHAAAAGVRHGAWTGRPPSASHQNLNCQTRSWWWRSWPLRRRRPSLFFRVFFRSFELFVGWFFCCFVFLC